MQARSADPALAATAQWSEAYPPATPAIRLSGVVREYGEMVALRGVSLELAAGRTLCVLGPNGAGKTTLLRILAGLLRPTRGRVEVLGNELPREAWKMRTRVGYLGHQALLYRELSARENLRFHAKLFGLADDGADRIEELLVAVGLQRRGDDRVREMSAGMIQRLAACRAILHSPELLLLDEPLAHVDPEASATVGALLGSGGGHTRVLVTHDIDAGLAEADQVLALDRTGAVAGLGAAEAFNDEELRSVYAGEVPGTAVQTRRGEAVGGAPGGTPSPARGR